MHTEREGVERLGRIAEEAASLLKKMKVPIEAVYSDPRYYPKPEKDENSGEDKEKRNWQTVVVAGIAFHLDHDRKMAIPFTPLPAKLPSHQKSNKSLSKQSPEKST